MRDSVELTTGLFTPHFGSSWLDYEVLVDRFLSNIPATLRVQHVLVLPALFSAAQK